MLLLMVMVVQTLTVKHDRVLGDLVLLIGGIVSIMGEVVIMAGELAFMLEVLEGVKGTHKVKHFC